MQLPTAVTVSKKVTRLNNLPRASHLCSLFWSLHTINKLGLYMNWRYCGKASIKFLNLSNSVWNLTKLAVKLKKVASKVLTEVARHVGRWPRGQTSYVRKGTQGMLARNHVSLQGTFTSEYISTQAMLTREARKHIMHADKWARKNAKHVGTWACKHARHAGTRARKHARKVAHKHGRDVGTWARFYHAEDAI